MCDLAITYSGVVHKPSDFNNSFACLYISRLSKGFS